MQRRGNRAVNWWANRRPRRVARANLVGVTRSEIRVAVDGRTATVQGEMMARTRQGPDFVVYGATSWDDGAAVTDKDAERIRSVLQEAAEASRWRLEFDGPLRQREPFRPPPWLQELARERGIDLDAD